MKNGGKNKSVAFIILFSICNYDKCDIILKSDFYLQTLVR